MAIATTKLQKKVHKFNQMRRNRTFKYVFIMSSTCSYIFDYDFCYHSFRMANHPLTLSLLIINTALILPRQLTPASLFCVWHCRRIIIVELLFKVLGTGDTSTGMGKKTRAVQYDQLIIGHWSKSLDGYNKINRAHTIIVFGYFSAFEIKVRSVLTVGW